MNNKLLLGLGFLFIATITGLLPSWGCWAALAGFLIYAIYMIVCLSSAGTWCKRHQQWEPKKWHPTCEGNCPDPQCKDC